MRFTLASVSATANKPMASATRLKPSVSSGTSKAKRCTPEFTSVPIRPRIRPITTMAMPLIGEPRASVDAASRPSTIKAKYSAGPKLSATSTITGEKNTMMTMPMQAPMNEANIAMNSAAPALPCLAIGWPSRQVTACEATPGTLSRIEVVAPPYWAP